MINRRNLFPRAALVMAAAALLSITRENHARHFQAVAHICRAQAPALEEARPGHRVACWRAAHA